MTTEEKIDRLTTIVDSLAVSVVHHDDRIRALITIGEDNAQRLKEVTEAIAKPEKQ